MDNRFHRQSLRVGLIAAVVALTGVATGFAQEKVEPAKKLAAADFVKPGNLLMAGYATPGSPMSAALKLADGNLSSTPLGATIYYAVYQRGTGNRAADAWGVRANFDSSFVEGVNFRQGVSPPLDTEAEYLYLYQVVNDRAIHDPALAKVKGVVGAVDQNTTNLTKDIESFALRLVVDPREITSWGYFTASGFSLNVLNEEKPAETIQMAVSGHPSIAKVLPPKNYRPWAPAKAIDRSKTAMTIAADNQNLDKNQNLVKEMIKGVRQVNFGEATAKGGMAPHRVQILVLDTPASILDANRDYNELPARAIFRVDWDQPIPEGKHSVIFGFTSRIRPSIQPIVIKDPIASRKFPTTGAEVENDFRPVAYDEGVEPAADASVVGVKGGAPNIPSPQDSGPASVGVAGGGLLSGGISGGSTSGFGGGGGGPLGGGIGAIGAARPATGGGGGQGDGGGDSGGEQNQSQVPTITNTNNNVLTNQQQQAQLQAQLQAQIQAQLQKQFNNNSNGGHCPGNVVPEPTTMLLGLFGLPGLWFFCRRKSA